MILLDSDGLPFLNGTWWILVCGLLIFLKRKISIIDMSFAMEQKIIYVIMVLRQRVQCTLKFCPSHNPVYIISKISYEQRGNQSRSFSIHTKPKKNVESTVLLFQHKNPPSKPSTSNLSKSKKNFDTQLHTELPSLATQSIHTGM